MDEETATIALGLVTVLAIFVAVQPILPSNAESFSELGVLGPNQKIGGYPTSLTVGQQFQLYGYMGNHEGVVSYYQVLVKLGNQTTQISNSTSARAAVISSYSLVLNDNQSSTFPMQLSIGQAGTNQRVIFELWSSNVTNSQFRYTGLFAQLWLNVTRT